MTPRICTNSFAGSTCIYWTQEAINESKIQLDGLTEHTVDLWIFHQRSEISSSSSSLHSG